VSFLNGIPLNDLVTTAVTCIGPAGVWATFWPGHREKLRERRENQLERLLGLHVELRVIGAWAGNTYDDKAHDPNWYNGDWGVRQFPWKHVEYFNRLVIAGDFPHELTTAVILLEESARTFHDLLEDQAAFRATAPAGLHGKWAWAVGLAKTKGAELSAEELTKIEAQDRPWLMNLYSRNKAIHVVGIGRPHQNGLHEAWRSANEQLVVARKSLQSADDPWWRWVGHVLAGIFGVIGLIFLLNFAWLMTTRPHGAVASQATQQTAVSPPAPTKPDLLPRSWSSAPRSVTARTSPPPLPADSTQRPPPGK
jgi:hypothetical protein